MAMAPHSLTHLAVGQVRQLPKGIWAISRIFGSFFITALYRSRNPLFILVYMIESELGSYCNIACTQSRRIVWLKVFLIRGLNLLLDLKDSLFRYQVRLDSARNERTKLMFCTTGIQLRKLSGNNSLSDVTRVVVDEWKNASSTVNNRENRRTLFYPQWIGGGGVTEIDMLIDRFSASIRFGRASSDWILPLHSLLSPTEQRKVFQSPPENIHKVIVATDIADTSFTISYQAWKFQFYILRRVEVKKGG
uniref:Helicase C-terminal domain-containing protein n=1 Tax=Oryza meridionalis TaxID=40149 RepID=A0A0E0FER8_9ORYZ